MSNLYDKAHELSKLIAESIEFQSLRDYFEIVERDVEAKKMLENFRHLQMEIYDKQSQGLELSQEEITKAQQMFEHVQQHEVIGKLMEAEQRMGQLISDINKIVAEPLEKLYEITNN